MAVNIPGVVAMFFFYLLVYGIGIWAYFKGRREKRKHTTTFLEMSLLVSCHISLIVGIFTMTATWVGGGFIVGLAEMVYTPSMGVSWAATVILGYSASFIIGIRARNRARDSRHGGGGGVTGAALTKLKTSVILFWFVGAEVSYNVIFPQLVCIVFFHITNGYGAILGGALGFLIRLLSSEPLIGLAPVIAFPGSSLEDGTHLQYFPVKTFAMLCSLTAILFFSFLASQLFNNGLLPVRWDVFSVTAETSDPTS
ncbi:high affinity choline transporter 1-like [Dunckerocampus dactyliophorus]|uniref:high affinity choline transporter 1-like n=1 Tax=Dunckerocampus dactyliophorus TaxID=161453 RepID=UPI0024051053|nr:high affinity choline transporter 1-like [Dunckerocampus dactyliophorus]